MVTGWSFAEFAAASGACSLGVVTLVCSLGMAVQRAPRPELRGRLMGCGLMVASIAATAASVTLSVGMLLIGTTLIGVACAGTAGVCYLLRAGTPRRDDDDHGGGGPHGPQGPTDWDGFERDLWAHARRDRPTVGV